MEDREDFPEPGEEHVTREGADGSGQGERERFGLPENNEKRRKFFLDAKNRENFSFQKGRCYQADFFNPYLDFGNCALKLPGFSLNVIKYVDQKSHCLRYVFKNRETGNVYLNVNIALLWDDDLRKAIEADKEGDAALQAALGGQVDAVVKEGSPQDSPQFHEEETRDEPPRISKEDEISQATAAMEIHSPHGPDGEEGNISNPITHAGTHNSSASEADSRPMAPGLTAVEHVSDGGVSTGAATSKSDNADGVNTTGAQTDDVRGLLQATATGDKRGSETGIF